jgi:hypothetical protein
MPGSKFTFALLVGTALLASSAAGDSCKGDKKSSGDNRAVGAAFERLKKLAGDWELAAPPEGAPNGQVALRYRVTAGGSAVVETVFPGGDEEMVTVYHRDGDQILLTHYCMLGNQPQMRAKVVNGSDELFFEFAGGCNIDAAKDKHMHQARMRFVDADHLHNEWELFADGKPAGKHTVDLVRKK